MDRHGRWLAVGCGLVLLGSGMLAAQGRMELDGDPRCRSGVGAAEPILALVGDVSSRWENAVAAKLAALGPGGTLSVPGHPVFDTPAAIEAAIAEPLSRPLYKGSRLDIVVRCLERTETTARRLTARGTWTISRFYGQESAAGGPPMPRDLMPPYAGGFVAGVSQRQGTWVVTALRLDFDAPGDKTQSPRHAPSAVR